MSGDISIRPVVVSGNVNDDVILRFGEPYHDSELFGPERPLEVRGGKLVISDGYLSVPYEGKRVIFPLKPGEYMPGEKTTAGDPIIADTDDDHAPISRGQSAWPLPGGGAANVGRGLYRIFRSLPRRVVATCSRAQMAGFKTKLRAVWGGDDHVALCPLDNIALGVNAVIEGLGTYLERNITRAPQAGDVAIDWEWQAVDPESICMVNTIYNWRMAVWALLEATRAAGCVIACTESLCSKKPIPQPLAAELAGYAKDRLGLARPLEPVQSVHQFIKDMILARDWESKLPPVWIFNETELGHFVDLPIWIKIGPVRKYVSTARILEGLIKFRDIEKSQGKSTRSAVFVTCGKFGAFALDQHDNLHHCDTLTLNERVQEKNAIGDLFASVPLGVLASGIIEKARDLPGPGPSGARSHDSPVAPDQLWIAYGLLAASAAADSGVYDGFCHVSVAQVNSRLALKAGNYSYLSSVRELQEIFSAQDKDLESFVQDDVPKLRKAGFAAGQMPSLAALVEERVLTSAIG